MVYLNTKQPSVVKIITMDEAKRQGRPVFPYVALGVVLTLGFGVLALGAICKLCNNDTNATKVFISQLKLLKQGNVTEKASINKTYSVEFHVENKKRLIAEDAVKFCRKMGSSLLQPNSLESEKEIRDFLLSNAEVWGKCKRFTVAYKAIAEKKYTNSEGTKYFPSLTISYDVTHPSEHTKCLLVNNSMDAREVLCSELYTNCYGCEHEGYHQQCMLDSYLTSCYGFEQSPSKENVLTGFKYCNREFLTTNGGLALFDKDNMPSNRKMFYRASRKHVCTGEMGAISIKYVHLYKSMITNEEVPYKINVTITEPNYDCLAFDRNNKYRITTEPCNRKNCFICHSIRPLNQTPDNSGDDAQRETFLCNAKSQKLCTSLADIVQSLVTTFNINVKNAMTIAQAVIAKLNL